MLTQNCKKQQAILKFFSAVSSKQNHLLHVTMITAHLQTYPRTPTAGEVCLYPIQSVLYFQAAISDTTTVAVPSGNDKLNMYYYILFR
jgi:hypothetical protein